MLNFCTLFDKNYLSKGLALFDSLNHHCHEMSIFVLCLDDFTFNYLTQSTIKNIIPIPLSELEDFDKELLAAKNNRTLIEYYFTMSPCLPLFLLKKNPNMPWICSLDADIYFYDNPKPIFDSFEKKYSILITPHKFTPELLETGIEQYGIFNVSFQAFKNDRAGLDCLEKWRLNCISWCKNEYDSPNDRFADQKYLGTWLTDFPNKVMILDDEISGLAVWNINNYSLSFKNNNVFSNGKRIVFYHFHALNTFDEKLNERVFQRYKVLKNDILVNYIYNPYIYKIKCLNTDLIVFRNKYLKLFAFMDKKLFYNIFVLVKKLQRRILK